MKKCWKNAPISHFLTLNLRKLLIFEQKLKKKTCIFSSFLITFLDSPKKSILQ